MQSLPAGLAEGVVGSGAAWEAHGGKGGCRASWQRLCRQRVEPVGGGRDAATACSRGKVWSTCLSLCNADRLTVACARQLYH